MFSPTYGGLYAYAANNPVRYIDPDGRVNKKAFFFSTLQACGGIIEIVGGLLSTGLSAGTTTYAVIDGTYNFIDGVSGMVKAAKNDEWNGTIPEVTAFIVKKAGFDKQKQELAGAIANLADTVIDYKVIKKIAIPANGGKVISSVGKIINSLDNAGSGISESNAIFDTVKEVGESIQQIKQKKEIQKRAEYYYNLYKPKEN